MQVRHKALIISALAIILLFLIGGYFGLRTDSQEPRSAVLSFDTTAIIMIEFMDLADQANNIQLMRIDNGWERISESRFDDLPNEQASFLMDRFHHLPVKRDMGMIGLVGEHFDLTPSSMCRISFVEVDGITHSLYIGRSTFAPGKAGAWTYVNVPDEKVVYAVEGLLTATLRPGSDGL